MKPVFVIGVPHGGTSVVAGVLHHLGVSMGEIRPRGNYVSYEDIRARPFARGVWDRHPVDEAGFMRYCDMRDAEGSPWGLKTFAGRLFTQSARVRERFRYVWVRRPLLETIERDWVESARRFEAQWERARDLTGRWIEARRLVDMVKPVASVSYEQVCRHPRAFVQDLVSALDLCPSSGQVKSAVSFVRVK